MKKAIMSWRIGVICAIRAFKRGWEVSNRYNLQSGDTLTVNFKIEVHIE